MGSIGEEINKKYGFDVPSLRLLEEVGIVNALIAEAEDAVEPDECAGFQCGQYLLLVKSESSTALHYKMLLLTRLEKNSIWPFTKKRQLCLFVRLGKGNGKGTKCKSGTVQDYRIQ